MIKEGQFAAWFKTPIGQGAGVVELRPDGRLSGRDETFSYFGGWSDDGERFTATFCTKRVAIGPPGVFGRDDVHVRVSGRAGGGDTVHASGFAVQTPGLRLELTLVRIRDRDLTYDQEAKADRDTPTRSPALPTHLTSHAGLIPRRKYKGERWRLSR